MSYEFGRWERPSPGRSAAKQSNELAATAKGPNHGTVGALCTAAFTVRPIHGRSSDPA
jgi:hypothetical protein